MKKKKHPMNW